MIKNIFNSFVRQSQQQTYKPLFSGKVPNYQFKSSNTYLRKKDLYSVLGVSKSASQKDIKGAYYKLAQKWHPDRNKDESAKDKFAEINNAYETLKDEQKRSVYDSMGLTGDEQNQAGFGEGGGPFGAGGNPFGQGGPFGGFGGFGGNQSQEEMFGDFESFFNMGGQGTRARKGQDIHLNVNISFKESVNGTNKQIKYEKKGTCTTCNGSKCKPGTAPSRCTACGGKGSINYRQGPMTIQMACTKCKGSGQTIKYPCGTCKGTGIGRVSTNETISIPKGIAHGQNMRMSQKGNSSESGGMAGDVLIKVNVTPDKYFRREGNDIYTTAYLTVTDAILGTKVEVETIHGSKQQVPVKPGTQHGSKYMLRGQGVNGLGSNQGQRGDQYVIFKIHIPTTLDNNQKEAIQQLSSVEKKIDPSMNNDNDQKFEDAGRKQQQQSRRQQEEEQFNEDFFGRFKNMWG